MVIAYLVSSIISLIFLCGYILLVKNKNRWLSLLFISVFVVNLGYLLISVSKTLDFALFSNKISYFGSILLPISMLMIIIKLCKLKYYKSIPIILLSLGSIIFIIVSTTGYLPWYYESATIEFINGGTILVKEYGPLHIIYLFYLIITFLSMIICITVSLVKKKIEDYICPITLCIVVLGNIAVWFIEQKLTVNFEFLSVSYLFSEIIILGLYILVEGFNKKLQNVSLKTVVVEKNVEDKLELILSKLPENIELSSRELDILNRILNNYKRKAIADDLNLSENTVKTYTRNLYNKLNVSSRDEIFELLK